MPRKGEKKRGQERGGKHLNKQSGYGWCTVEEKGGAGIESADYLVSYLATLLIMDLGASTVGLENFK